ncbi:MAG: hypothetical protein PVG45_09245 [Gammaproteobacteria bacterium]|jgi:hypothetical protein
MPHKLSMVVPGLCGPLPDSANLETATRPLVDLLRQARRKKTAGSDIYTQLSALFGLKTERPFPVAAVSMLGHGLAPGNDCWIHADPANLQADMDRAILSDSQLLHIRPDEAERLVKQLNDHFAVDGLSIVMADENNWFIKLDDCNLQTTPLPSAVGRNINHLMPAGEAAARWQPVLNEIQMLLHMSDVNQQREDRGMAPVNSLWLWGEGVLPERGDSDITHVYADDALTSGAAKLDQIKFSPLTDPIPLAYAMQQDGHSLICLKQLDGPCNYGDTSAWLDQLTDVVEDWLKPLIETARSLDAEVNIYPCNGVRYHFDNKNKFRISDLIFWKKDRLQDYVETQ